MSGIYLLTKISSVVSKCIFCLGAKVSWNFADICTQFSRVWQYSYKIFWPKKRTDERVEKVTQTVENNPQSSIRYIYLSKLTCLWELVIRFYTKTHIFIRTKLQRYRKTFLRFCEWFTSVLNNDDVRFFTNEACVTVLYAIQEIE